MVAPPKAAHPGRTLSAALAGSSPTRARGSPQWFEVTFRVAIQAKGRPPTPEEAEMLAAHWIDEGSHLAVSPNSDGGLSIGGGELRIDDSVNFAAVKVAGPA